MSFYSYRVKTLYSKSTFEYRAKEVPYGQEASKGFFLKDKLLYYKENPGDHERLVVPQQLRDQVLNLGHCNPWDGHLGARKTLDRISSTFYWPGLNKEVQNYCQSCPVCQLASNKNVPRFPLQPVTIVLGTLKLFLCKISQLNK